MIEREANLQARCIKIARKYGAYVYKNVQNELTERGRPDLTLCVPISIEQYRHLFKDKKIGLFVGVELKREGHLNELSKPQEIVGNKIKQAGGIWVAIDDSNLLDALLEQLIK